MTCARRRGMMIMHTARCSAHSLGSVRSAGGQADAVLQLTDVKLLNGPGQVMQPP